MKMPNDQTQAPQMETEVQIIDSASFSVLEAQERAAIDVQIATAKRYPMHSTADQIRRFLGEAMALATTNEKTALSCLWAEGKGIPRGNKMLHGPSIRLAEIAVHAYGNLRIRARVIDTTATEVISMGVCFDVERNVAYEVEHHGRITTREGKRYNDDGIRNAQNASCSFSLRNAIFRVIPRALIDDIYEAARTKAIGSVETLPVRAVKAVQAYERINISEERVLARINRPSVSEINLDDLAVLGGLFNTIRAREVSAEEAFPPLESESDQGKMAGLVDEIRNNLLKRAKKEAVKKPEKKAAAGTIKTKEDLRNHLTTHDQPEPKPEPEPAPEVDKEAEAAKEAEQYLQLEADAKAEEVFGIKPQKDKDREKA